MQMYHSECDMKSKQKVAQQLAFEAFEWDCENQPENPEAAVEANSSQKNREYLERWFWQLFRNYIWKYSHRNKIAVI